MTKWELMRRLFATSTDNFYQDWKDSSGRNYLGKLVAIEKEDGSGSSFNVTINYYSEHHKKAFRHTFHIRTID